MPPNIKKYVGLQFNRWTVVRYSHYSGHVYWLCRCVCGKESLVRQYHLESGDSVSCGCARQEMYTREDLTGKVFGRWTAIKFSHARNHLYYWECRCLCGKLKKLSSMSLKKTKRKHCTCNRKIYGSVPDPMYFVWKSMMGRCYNKNSTFFVHYGGRGIYVVPRWHTYETFRADMGQRPSPKHSIDRINNDGPYSPENCRWVTQDIQARNRRTTHSVSYSGETLTLPEWARRLGISRDVLYLRLFRRKWSVEKAFTTPLKGNRASVRFPPI